MKEKEHSQSLEDLIHLYQRCERLQELKGRSMSREEAEKVFEIKHQAARDMFEILEERFNGFRLPNEKTNNE